MMHARRGLLRSMLGASLLASGGLKSLTAAGRTACLALPEETSGPFPADGSGANPRVHSILSLPGILRSDIRSSFGASATIAAGVPLRLALTVVDLKGACAPLAGAAVYLWNCDRAGRYSLYGTGLEHENYLRGVQISDHAGRISFQTIFPACYPGRYPHLHLEVFDPKAASLNAGSRIRTTQLTLPARVCREIYATSPGYADSVAQFQDLTPAQDDVFAYSSPGQLARQTLRVSLDPVAGLVGRAEIG